AQVVERAFCYPLCVSRSLSWSQSRWGRDRSEGRLSTRRSREGAGGGRGERKRKRAAVITFPVLPQRGDKVSGNPCPICRDPKIHVDYRNVKLLEQFISPHTGQMYDPTRTGKPAVTSWLLRGGGAEGAGRVGVGVGGHSNGPALGREGGNGVTKHREGRGEAVEG
uniref:Small ribosomal subunit protein mS40 n=1 Tax=Callorhinchus milii TaxID=7868 RepID=A0A4W3GKI4_CALMI